MGTPLDQPAGRHRFATTHWSLVVAAGDVRREDARAALAQLCETYWFPLYCYVRRRGHTPEDAQDLTQAFFARLLERQAIQAADPHRGRFRSFLLASVDHFLANARDRARAQKRGGGRRPLSLDLPAESLARFEPAHDVTPERLFDRQWAVAVLEVVVQRLEAEYAAAGKSRQFALLKDALAGDRDRLPFAQIADALQVTAEAARQAAHRLRKRYRVLLREEVARTVADPAEVDDELAGLLAALGK